MPKKQVVTKATSKKSTTRTPTATGSSRRKTAPDVVLQSGHDTILTGLTVLIGESRRRALATVNCELVCLYWQIGHTIVQQQETANWGDAVVEKLATDLRSAFPDMKGLSRDNVFRMRQFFLANRETDGWFRENLATTPHEVGSAKVGTPSRQITVRTKVGTAPRLLPGILGDSISEDLCALILGLSWSHQTIIIGAVAAPAERYFYMTMSVRERWSVRELRRQIDSDLFTRYVSVKSHPEKCLPEHPEAGDLLPFKDHYVLEFLGLEDEHTEKQLRKSILANLRDFFLEFGKDLTFVGEEYPLTVGADTFYIDLLFFHRRRFSPLAPALRGEGPGVRGSSPIDLKIGKFKPEHAGKSRFYCAALDEQLRLAHENPSLGLVLCKSADKVQVRLALTAAAVNKTGVATYQTALPNERLIQRRLEQLPNPSETDE